MAMQCLSYKDCDKYVIIVAGGSGRRMNAELEKQFLPLGKSVVLLECLKKVHDSVPEASLIVVLPKGRVDYWTELCDLYKCDIDHKVVEGGAERFYSVKAAVDSIQQSERRILVAVHDGVRPFVDESVFARCFEVAFESGAAVASIDCVDSLRYDGKAIERAKVKLVQTPQCFDFSLLKKAYSQEYESRFTDDASLVEAIGGKIVLVEGKKENIKLTQPFDFLIAEKLIDGKGN